jgi:hypothetical protein
MKRVLDLDQGMLGVQLPSLTCVADGQCRLAMPVMGFFRRGVGMMCVASFGLLAMGSSNPLGAAEESAAKVPAAKIDLGTLPAQARLIEEVVVPVPSEIFGVLDKLGKPQWEGVLRMSKGGSKPMGGAEQTALILGTVIAEGFIAVEAESAEDVKRIGKSVLTLSEAIAVKRAVQRRSQSIVEAANEKDWAKVRRELDGALMDVKGAMTELRSEELSHLVSLGGWLRGTEALATVVSQKFTKDGGELLHQPVLLEHFEKRISAMTPKRQTPLVEVVRKGLQDIRPLMGGSEGDEISEKTVSEIGAISARLVKAIQSKGN